MKFIKSITNNGIHYIDEDGNESFVDFKQCSDNWIKYRKRNENLDDEKVDELKKVNKCIGQRDICANPHFIEFFTRPFTRFEFIKSDECPDPEEAFRRLQNDIVSAGWATIDLS